MSDPLFKDADQQEREIVAEQDPRTTDNVDTSEPNATAPVPTPGFSNSATVLPPHVVEVPLEDNDSKT